MEAIFLELVKLSLIGSLFAAAVMLVRLILPKTPKWIFCLLWGVVALRLICPVSVESRLSLVPDRIASGQVITSIGDMYIGDVDVIYESNEEYGDALDAGRQPIYSGDGYYVVTEKDTLEAPKTVSETLYPILSWIWVTGMALMLLYTAASYLMLRRKMAEATLLRDNIWQCEQVDSPFVLGFIKPKIYLPYTITGSDMANVIAHEQAHIHRKDHWWKPAGFILLSIHWFNPVLWLAYILLCRDIEAACDEKVIRRMEKDEMRAYSTALLNCSVNRRRIAACPLAFGEVGVKERVKTVMNYKKPAFWIVIAAVALCIVVAVSFLTNPKDYGPQVGNPQMLELPGVAWFATPDEVKAALNITQEQIVEEFTTSGFVMEMWVTDLTLYGRDVPFARFSFWFNNNGDTALRRASVFFSEDTDMNKLKKELIEIYGPGKSEPYRYSLYDNNADRNGRFGRRVSNLEAAAENENGQNVVEGNPFRDALEDPEYMTHHWVAENSSSFIPEEIVEYFRSAEEEDMPQDDDAFTEKLDQMPWIVISLSNRNPGGVLHDITGSDEPPTRYYTKNCIEFSADLLSEYLYAAQMARVEDATTATDPSMLEFPGLKWNMTPEEVKNALNLTNDQIVHENAQEADPQSAMPLEGYTMHVRNLSLFGADILNAKFSFLRYEGNDFGLCAVEIYYPEETDMQIVVDDMAEFYGEGTDDPFIDHTFIDGKLTPLIDSGNHTINGKIWAPEKDPDYIRSYWRSTKKGTEVLSADAQSRMANFFAGLEHLQITPEVALELLEKQPMVQVYAVNRNPTAAQYSNNSGITHNYVRFAADYLVQMIQRFSTNPINQEVQLDRSMLEFPGLKWNMTPEEVKKSLGLTTDQILVDAQIEHLELMDTWGLIATAVPFFGEEVMQAQFRFAKYAGYDEFGLYSIRIYYPDEVDMSEVRDTLISIYGTGNSTGITRYHISNGKVRSSVDNKLYASSIPDPLLYCWESSSKGTDVLPKAVQEEIIAIYTDPDFDNFADRDVVLEYLEKSPLVTLYCTDGAGEGNLSADDLYTCNHVNFSAADYIDRIQRFGN